MLLLLLLLQLYYRALFFSIIWFLLNGDVFTFCILENVTQQILCNYKKRLYQIQVYNSSLDFGFVLKCKANQTTIFCSFFFKPQTSRTWFLFFLIVILWWSSQRNVKFLLFLGLILLRFNRLLEYEGSLYRIKMYSEL